MILTPAAREAASQILRDLPPAPAAKADPRTSQTPPSDRALSPSPFNPNPRGHSPDGPPSPTRSDIEREYWSDEFRAMGIKRYPRGVSVDENDYSDEENAENQGYMSCDPTPRYTLSPGGPAARKVYDTQEVRSLILELADQSTLAVCLRLEKAVGESVAKVLFRTVHMSVMKKMSRANARRKMYCDAVRVVDRSPQPTLIPAERKFQPTEREKVRFDPEQALKLVEAGKKKYPNLTTILYQYPLHNNDDAYTIHIQGDKIVVDLERRFDMDIHDPSQPEAGVNTFDAGPKYKGMTIRDTIAINLVVQDVDHYEHWIRHPEGLDDHLRKWKDWLFCNSELDRRVTSIDRGLYSMNPRLEKWEYREKEYQAASRRVEPTLDEMLAFLARRKRQNCEPLTHFYLPPSPNSDPVNAERFYEIVKSLNPEVRSLRLHKSFIQNLPSFRTAIKAFDEALPTLHKLAVTHERYKGEKPSPSHIKKIPLAGLPSLRNFACTIKSVDTAFVGRYLCRVGAPMCFYQDLDTADTGTLKWRNERIHELKPYVLEGRDYRYGRRVLKAPMD